MGRPWYDKDPARYEAIRREVENTYPDLHFVRRDRSVLLVGQYPLFEGDLVVDRYKIEVELPTESEMGLPVVREVGNRIPRAAERHMDPDGKACIVLPDAFWYDNPVGMSLMDFLSGPVRSYFATQSLIEMGKPDVWGAGEWGHGADGIVEFYESVLGTRDRHVIWEYLKLLKHGVVKGHWSCPCGSGDKLRKCHLELVRDLQARIPPPVAARSEERLRQTLSSAPSSSGQRVGHIRP
jgi:hypothetical protein